MLPVQVQFTHKARNLLTLVSVLVDDGFLLFTSVHASGSGFLVSASKNSILLIMVIELSGVQFGLQSYA